MTKEQEERLRKIADHDRDDHSLTITDLRAALDELSALRARVKELEAALRRCERAAAEWQEQRDAIDYNIVDPAKANDDIIEAAEEMSRAVCREWPRRVLEEK